MPVPFNPELAVAALQLLLDDPDADRAFTTLRARHPALHGMLVDEHVQTARQVLRDIEVAAERIRAGNDEEETQRDALLQRLHFMPRDAVLRALARLQPRS